MEYSVEEGTVGRRMVLSGRWEPGYARDAQRLGVVELELNYAKGWKGGDVAFLADLTFLRVLEITDWNLRDVSPVHGLRALTRLKISTYCNTAIDFTSFPELEDLSLEWRAKATSLFECRSVERVFLNKYTGDDLAPLLGLPRLVHLAVAGPKISMVGASPGTPLEFLGVYGAKRLTSLRGVEYLAKLRALEVNDCKNALDIEPLRALRGLESVHLCDDGDIESLEPLAEHGRLKELLFFGSTSVRDGRISVLRPLLLRKVVFQDRRHYDMKRAEFPSG